MSTRIAIIGCGYVADYYARTLALHPELELACVADRDGARASAFADFHGYRVATVADILANGSIELVVNLTSTASHFDVSRAALESGKHVYSEKPLALEFPQAELLVRLAASRGLILGVAPGNVLGESAQTLWKAVRDGAIGTPRLVYAELDDGPIHQMDYRDWRSASGAPWPWKDEFETGCALEHAGYYLSWLAAFFGAASRVTTFASTLRPEKAPDAPLARHTPDFSVACIEYASGLVARLTCSILAPRDHSITIIGDEGTLVVQDCWDDGSPVILNASSRMSSRKSSRTSSTPRTPTSALSKWWPFLSRGQLSEGEVSMPLLREPPRSLPGTGGNRMDFTRGVAEVAAAARERRDCRLGGDYALHLAEIMLAMQYPDRMGSPRMLRSRFSPVAPMDWATGSGG